MRLVGGGERRGGSPIDPPFEVLAPANQTLPFVFASPHSGRVYHKSFLQVSRLDTVSIRRSEDSFVDEIFAAAPAMGAPLIKAHFPRAYVDPNRDETDMDVALLDAPWPHPASPSEKTAKGLGLI